MSYDPTWMNYEYDEDISLEENQKNLRDRSSHLYRWAKDNWKSSCHAAGCEAVAQYLESCPSETEEDLGWILESDGWVWAEGQLESYAMVEIMDAWVEAGTMYTESSYGWMLDAVGYDIPGVMEYVKEWCDSLAGKWYPKMDELKAIIAEEWHDMWDETI